MRRGSSWERLVMNMRRSECIKLTQTSVQNQKNYRSYASADFISFHCLVDSFFPAINENVFALFDKNKSWLYTQQWKTIVFFMGYFKECLSYCLIHEPN